MNKVLETKSQMIMRIAELSEANEQLEAEIEKQKRELCQRYEEPEFATFLLMGKTAKEWQNIQKENEQLKKEVKKIGSSFINKGDYARDLEKELVTEHRLYLTALNTIKILQTENNQSLEIIDTLKEQIRELTAVLSEVNNMATTIVSQTETCKEIIGECDER